MEFSAGMAVAILSLFCVFEGSGVVSGQEVAVVGGTTLAPAQAKKKEFADKFAHCVAIKPIDSCLYETLEDLRSFMPLGIPELQLRPSEPLKIENIQFKTRPGIGVQIESEFSNVIVRHLSTFVANKISADLDSRTLLISLTVPMVKIRGNYKVEGNVFVFQISGNGPFQATLSGVTGVGSAAIDPVGPAGNQKLSIKRTNIDFDIASAHVQLDNLFDGRAPAVAKTVNDFINQNSGLIINEVKPQIREQVTVLVESVMNDAFSKLPADDFLKKLPPQIRSRPVVNIPVPPPHRIPSRRRSLQHRHF